MIYVIIQIIETSDELSEINPEKIHDEETWLLLKTLLISILILLWIQLSISKYLFLINIFTLLINIFIISKLNIKIIKKLNPVIKHLSIELIKIGRILILLQIIAIITYLIFKFFL